MELSPRNREGGWSFITNTTDVGAYFRSNGFPRRLLITFDSLNDFSHLRATGVSGEKVAVYCEADHLNIGTGKTDWFQSPELQSVVDAASKLRGNYEEAILYGHSMGGYAALLLSGALRATSVVAFVPQFSVNPDVTPFDQRFRGYTTNVDFCYDNMSETISKSVRKYIVFDPYCREDRGHFDLINENPNVVPIRIPFCGHYPGQLLREAGILRSTVVELLLETIPMGALRKRLRAARRRSHRYFVEKASHVARRGRLKQAIELVNVAYVLEPSTPSVLETYQAILALDTSFYGLAHAMLRLIASEQPEWRMYDGLRNMLWRELEKHANVVIKRVT